MAQESRARLTVSMLGAAARAQNGAGSRVRLSLSKPGVGA
jgi:hypothetical protein